MKHYCKHCDPKHFTIYGFCSNCNRRCECPPFVPNTAMSPIDYEVFKYRWDKERTDLVLDAQRKSERNNTG